MTVEAKDTEKLRKIVGLLEGKNCGKCGCDNCGAFAVALIASKVSPIDCRKSLDRIKEICEVLGIDVPEGAELLAVEHARGHGGGHGHHQPGSHHGGDGHGGDHGHHQPGSHRGGDGHGKGDHHHAGSHDTR